jgi:hypothetical protein
VITIPPEVEEAIVLDELARRYGCLPTDVADADVENFRIRQILIEAGQWNGGE